MFLQPRNNTCRNNRELGTNDRQPNQTLVPTLTSIHSKFGPAHWPDEPFPHPWATLPLPFPPSFRINCNQKEGHECSPPLTRRAMLRIRLRVCE